MSWKNTWMPCLYSRNEEAETSVDGGIGDSIHRYKSQFCATGLRNSAVLMHSWVTRDKNQCAMYF